jgi:hypothetical protein
MEAATPVALIPTLHSGKIKATRMITTAAAVVPKVATVKKTAAVLPSQILWGK